VIAKKENRTMNSVLVRWIDVNDAIPEASGRYLVWVNQRDRLPLKSKGHIDVCFFNNNLGMFTGMNAEHITHWASVPQPKVRAAREKPTTPELCLTGAEYHAKYVTCGQPAPDPYGETTPCVFPAGHPGRHSWNGPGYLSETF
jgi:hypothetical protein